MFKINWNVKTQAQAYVVGYQEAMKDIAHALETGGEDAVREWLKNNTIEVK